MGKRIRKQLNRALYYIIHILYFQLLIKTKMIMNNCPKNPLQFRTSSTDRLKSKKRKGLFLAFGHSFPPANKTAVRNPLSTSPCQVSAP